MSAPHRSSEWIDRPFLSGTLISLVAASPVAGSIAASLAAGLIVSN